MEKKRIYSIMFMVVIVSGFMIYKGDNEASIIATASISVDLIHASKAQMMFTQVITPIDPATEQITYDQINMTITGVVPDNVDRDLVENDDRVLVIELHELNIECLFVDPYSLNISVGAHARTWNGTTSSWNSIAVDYNLREFTMFTLFGMDIVDVTEINNRRSTVTISATIKMYITMADVLWDLGGEYGIQVGIFIRVDGQMIRFGDSVSSETPVKNFEVSAP